MPPIGLINTDSRILIGCSRKLLFMRQLQLGAFRLIREKGNFTIAFCYEFSLTGTKGGSEVKLSD